ncbi:hypothetical protein BDW62DRAFT_206288 [Aspergillus aurantiobrunneus]
MPPKHIPKCTHTSNSYYTPSPHAAKAHYTQPSKQQRLSAMKPSPSSNIPPPPTRTDLHNFPAPLVLPGDDLALDPEYSAQSFQEWYAEENRNPVTAARRTVYLVGPPETDGTGPMGIKEVRDWTVPGSWCNGDDDGSVSTPKTGDVLDYLSAFFHGLPVKQLKMPKGKWLFTRWTDGEDRMKPKTGKRGKPKRTAESQTQHIALSTPTEAIRIRTRPCPDKIYPRQLNLDDLLDVALSILPSDAYALCMLVHHDLYEDEEDSFVCGRAYGGSRVAVVSTARYNPLLDGLFGVERVHAWPGAHCGGYVEDMCRKAGGLRKRARVGVDDTAGSNGDAGHRDGPLESGLSVIRQHQRQQVGGRESEGLWLWRIVRTVSHELCHCFGLDHCVYYACIMQGSASLSEDTRQPPYLCPVDLAKVLCATGASVEERDRALLRYCEGLRVRGAVYFRAFAAWLSRSLEGFEKDVDG